MENVIDLFFRQKDEIGNVMFDEPEILIPGEMPNIRRIARDQIIYGNDAMPFRQKSIHQMRTEKTGAAGYDANRLGIFRHRRVVLIAAGIVCQQEVDLNDG